MVVHRASVILVTIGVVLSSGGSGRHGQSTQLLSSLLTSLFCVVVVEEGDMAGK
jgi:hypothetical protein